MSVHKKFSPIGPALWPAIRNIYIYECLVLLYRLEILFYHILFHNSYFIFFSRPLLSADPYDVSISSKGKQVK